MAFGRYGLWSRNEDMSNVVALARPGLIEALCGVTLAIEIL